MYGNGMGMVDEGYGITMFWFIGDGFDGSWWALAMVMADLICPFAGARSPLNSKITQNTKFDAWSLLRLLYI